MPRGGIKKKKNRNTSVAVQERCRSVPRGAPFPLFTCAISSFFAPKPHGNACYAGYGGPREQYRSVPRDGVKKERIGRGPREQYRSVPWDGVKKERIGRGPREQYRSVPRDGVKKERIGRGPRERCRSVSQGGVKKKEREREIGRGPSSIAQCHGVALKKKQREKK